MVCRHWAIDNQDRADKRPALTHDDYHKFASCRCEATDVSKLWCAGIGRSITKIEQIGLQRPMTMRKLLLVAVRSSV